MKPQPIDNSPLIEKILTDIGLSDYGDTGRGRQVSELARNMLAAIQGVFGHSSGDRYIRYFAKTALETLHCRIEDGNSGVTWHKPQTVYEFGIDWDWTEGEEPGSPIFIHPSDSGALEREFGDRSRFLDILRRISGYSGRYTFLRGITHEASYWIRNGLSVPWFPCCREDADQELVAWRNKGFHPSPIELFPVAWDPNEGVVDSVTEIRRKCRAELTPDKSLELGFSDNLPPSPLGRLYVSFRPLIVDQDRKRAYYPIETGFTFKIEPDHALHPGSLSRMGQRTWWDSLLAHLDRTMHTSHLDVGIQKGLGDSKLPVPVPSEHDDCFLAKVQTMIQATMREELDALLTRAKPHPAASVESPKKHSNRDLRLSQFEPLQNLKWQEIDIRFLSEHEVEVTAKHAQMIYSYDMLGLRDAKTGKPNTLWALLLAFGAYSGRIPSKNRLPVNLSKNLPTWIAKLRRHLRGLTGIESDPFHPWLRERCYASRFSITYDVKAVTPMIESDPKDEMEESFNEESSRFTRHTGGR